MKTRLFALLTALLVLVAGLACAETLQFGTKDDPFAVTCVIPEGYVTESSFENDTLAILFDDKEGVKTDYWVAIGFSEEFAGRSFGDLTAEEKTELTSVFNDDFSTPLITEKVTKEGTGLLVMDENDPESESDFAIIVTVYRGYIVQVYVWNPEYTALSEAQIDLAVEILGDTHFVE